MSLLKWMTLCVIVWRVKLIRLKNKKNIMFKMKNKIIALQEECWELMLQDPDGAMALATESITLIGSTGLRECLGKSLFMQGWCHIYAGRYPEAPSFFQESISEFMLLHDIAQIARSYNGMGSAYKSLGQFGIAAQHYETALSMTEQIENSDFSFITKMNLASLFCSEGEWGTAKKFISELETYDLNKYSEEYLAEYYYVKAWSMLEDDDISQVDQLVALAEKYAKEAKFAQLLFHIGLLQVKCLEKKENISEAISELLKLMGSASFKQQGVERYLALTLLASWYLKEGNIELARKSFKSAFLLEENPWPHQFLFDLHQAYSEFFAKQDLYSEAYRQSQYALKIQHDLNSKESASSESNREISKEIARLRKEDLAKEVDIKALHLLHERTQLINNIGQQLASTFDIDSIGLKIYDVVNRELDVHFISIAEYVPSEKLFKFEIMVDQGVALEAMTRPLDTPGMQAAQIVQSRKLVLKNNFSPTNESLVKGDGSLMPRSAIFLPLDVEGELIGVWSLQSSIENRFKDEDVDMLNSLTPFVAIAFNNALSHRRLKQLNADIKREKESVVLAHKKVEHQALHDGLTSLPNRRLLTRYVSQRVEEALQQEKKFHLLYIDLNGFKAVNDLHGHKLGDLVLQKMAERLHENFRDSDILARVGGDEFVAVVSEFSQLKILDQFVERLKRALSEELVVQHEVFSIGASVGVASFPLDGVNLDQLIHEADEKMYQDKALS